MQELEKLELEKFADLFEARFRNLEPDNFEPDVCRGSKQRSCQSRADRFDAVYLRAAQAYMLISMPTGTSTIFGVFQVIRGPPN
jgi:hypothetical protein